MPPIGEFLALFVNVSKLFVKLLVRKKVNQDDSRAKFCHDILQLNLE